MGLRGIFDPENGFFRTLSRMVDVVGLSLFMGGALPPSGHLRPGLCRPVPHGDPLCGPPGDSTYLTFFRSFRANLRVGIPAGLLVLAAGALLLQGYQIMVLAANSVGGGALAMYGCYCAALIVPAGVSCWAFPLLSRFQMGLGHLLVTSFQVTLRHLPQTLLLILLLFVTVWATAGFFPLAVFTPALNALLASMPAERVIRRYLPEKEPEGEEL